MMQSKSWTIELVDGGAVIVNAQIVTYDQAGNLIFCDEKAVMDQGGQKGLELLQCINSRQYIRYYPTPTAH